MPTIAENLQTLIDIRDGLKEALDKQGKEPTDAMGSYADLIDGLENPEKVVYMVTIDGGESSHYAQLLGEEKVELTATANDVRLGTSVISDDGYLEGEKVIPAYISAHGMKLTPASKEIVLSGYETNYDQIMLSIASYDTNMSGSTMINYISISDSMYEAGTGAKISDITKDIENDQINLGITPTEKSVLRYCILREEG